MCIIYSALWESVFSSFLRLMQNTTCLDSYDCRNNYAFTSHLMFLKVSMGGSMNLLDYCVV